MTPSLESKHKGSIFVIDDEPASLKLLLTILTEHGYAVHPANEGELGLQLQFVKDKLPDLVLLDLRIPGMDGYQVCASLKNDSTTRAIPVIFISSIDHSINQAKALLSGAADYITKPFDAEEVLWRIETHISLRRLRDNLESAVRRRIAQLDTTSEELERALQEIHVLTQVTGRKHAEEKIREQEAELRQVLDLAPQHIVVLGPDGSRLYSNHAALDYYGLTLEEWRSYDPRRLFHPDDCERMTSGARIKILNESPHEAEARLLRKDGKYHWFLFRFNPLRDGQGHITRWYLAATDIEDHLGFLESMHQVNRAIQGTNDLEQMMSDVLGAVLSIFNCDRTWLVYPCDPEAVSWKVPMEHARPEFPGAFAPGLDLPVDSDIAKVFQMVRASSSPVRFGSESEHPLPAEAAKRFSIQSIIGMAIYPKGDKPYMLGLHQCSYPRVWTAQEERLFQEIGRRLEDALTSLLMFRNQGESERKLEEAQRLTHVGYWECDPDTDLITWSDETYRIFGLRPQERILNLAQLSELVHPEDKQIVVEAVAAALRGGPRYDIEYRVVRPNGEVRLVHSQGDVMRDESGRPRRMFGTVQDTTERKRAEDELRRSEADLRKAQAELAHVTRVTTMGELTASIAHEVKQPLTAVIANANASLRWLAGASPNLDEARDAVSRIVRDGNRASDVIGRIHALVKKGDTEKTFLDINEVIQEVLSLTHSEILKYGVVLKMSLDAGLPRVLGDRIQLQQVILNLVMNGIEAMNTVTDRTREMLIRSSHHESDRVLVAVQDSGIGIDAQNLEKIFDTFYTTKSQGMGMGLAISRSIVENHGGRLWAVPNDGPGAAFQFTLLKYH